MNNKIKRIAIVAGLAVLSILTVRFDAKPKLFVGLILAYIGVFFAGTNLSMKSSAPVGAATVLLGLLVRKFYPMAIKLKGDKLAAFLPKLDAYNGFLDKYAVLLIILGGIICILGFKTGEILEEFKSNKFTTNRLTYLALFVALSVAINTVRVGSISFGGFPIILSGYLMGPVNGFLVGAVADLLGFIIRPGGAFNPVYTLTSALTGAIPVVVTALLKEKYPNYSFLKVLVGIFVGQMLTSVIMVPFFMSIFLGKKTFLGYAAGAFIKQIISIPIYSFLTVSINESLSKGINFQKVAKIDK